uniref:Ribonuclease n=2 Tax=Emiliania huxleyi TaxID=2903 RepID=A0A7S3W1W2_EMIHU|mmetsp:Transcript_7467/g.24880  ORF Transcript_7467/g.24880 Transcript_7467/m.24880 type:complete len:311 (+) Transcript_7467:72-1004(+)
MGASAVPGVRRSARLMQELPVAKRERPVTGERPVAKREKRREVPDTKREKAKAFATAAHASTAREASARADGVELIVGCDEAGRGPLAGPVVAAACAFSPGAEPIPGVGDSKSIADEAEREALYEQIVAAPGVVWSARVVSAARVDEVNILMASLEAMRLSIVDVLGASQRRPATALALIDGPFSPWKEGEKYVDFQQPQPPSDVALQVEPIKGGDAKVYCIAAASILAKVTRDRLMRRYAELWPEYGLAEHKGYPTARHVAAIAKHGATAIHRRTFAPLKAQELPPPSADELRQIEAIEAAAQAKEGTP